MYVRVMESAERLDFTLRDGSMGIPYHGSPSVSRMQLDRVGCSGTENLTLNSNAMLVLSDGPGNMYDDQMACTWNIEVQGPIKVVLTEMSTADDDVVTITAEEGADPKVYNGSVSLPQLFTTTGKAKRIVVTFTAAAAESKSSEAPGSSSRSGFRLALSTDDAGCPPLPHIQRTHAPTQCVPERQRTATMVQVLNAPKA